MIALLRGRVAAVQEDAVVLDVGGVGYLVHAAPRVLTQLQTMRDAIELHIDTQVREDAITLFGFLDPAERVWFRLLQAIQGVGARTALAVLGTLTPDQLVAAVAAQDRAALTRAGRRRPRAREPHPGRAQGPGRRRRPQGDADGRQARRAAGPPMMPSRRW